MLLCRQAFVPLIIIPYFLVKGGKIVKSATALLFIRAKDVYFK